MDNDKIPYIAFEAEMARHERTIKRLLVALVVSIALVFISNIAWLWFFNQFDYSTDTVTQGTAEDATEWAGLPQEMRLKCHADSVR